jgi:hypothetical protein
MPQLPVLRYLPFLPEYAIQTSILMLESEVGVNGAAIRQDAGRLMKTPRSCAVSVLAASD